MQSPYLPVSAVASVLQLPNLPENTDPETLPNNSTSYVMMKAPGVALKDIGGTYGFRTWIEYGLKQ